MQFRPAWLALIGAGLLLAGCGKSTNTSQPSSTGGASQDQAQVSSVLASNPTFVDEDAYESNSEQVLETSGPDGSYALIRPLRFWRVIDSVNRTFDFAFSDPDSSGRPTRAIVTVHKRLQGHFNILVGDTTATDTSLNVLHKPLDDRWVRKLALVRMNTDSTGDHSRWHLVGTSGVDITSLNAITTISSVRIQAGALDTTVTDVLELHRLRRLIRIPTETPVTITATTNSADNVVLFYGHDMRRRFHSNGDGTFTFQFVTGDFGGLRHFGVNALSHGTLFDDSAPYDSKAWIIPFAVRDADCDIDHE